MEIDIKFKVFDGDTIISLSEAIHRELVVIQHNRKDGFDISTEYDHVSLMQFTGFTDTDGVDIYNSDILDSKFKAIVSFKNGSFIVSNRENNNVKGLLGEFIRIRIQGTGNCQVVGNICLKI